MNKENENEDKIRTEIRKRALDLALALLRDGDDSSELVSAMALINIANGAASRSAGS